MSRNQVRIGRAAFSQYSFARALPRSTFLTVESKVMPLLKIVVLIAFGIVVVKFVASLFGRGNNPFLNRLVTVILSLFVAWELFTLGRILVDKFV